MTEYGQHHFLNYFYSSLELSEEDNQKHYLDGNVKFDLGGFYEITDSGATYSRERVGKLSGEYHDRYHIEFGGIDSHTVRSGRIIVTSKAVYSMYEMGTFVNLESFVLVRDENTYALKMTEWKDVKVIEMALSGYDGMENFQAADFYDSIGSVNK